MEKISLKATSRTITGKKVKTLRKTGLIPANIFGKKVKSAAISVDGKEFSTVFSKAGETGLVEIHLGSDKRPVLVHQVQYHPVTSLPLHVDFFQVDLKEKVTAKVPLVLVGEAPAVVERVGVLLTLLSEIEVEALPTDLPEKVEADVSTLKEVGQTLQVSTLKVSEKVKILSDANQDIVKVAPLVSKEAEKMAAEAQAAAAAAAAASAAAVPAATQTEGTESAPKAPDPAQGKKES